MAQNEPKSRVVGGASGVRYPGAVGLLAKPRLELVCVAVVVAACSALAPTVSFAMDGGTIEPAREGPVLRLPDPPQGSIRERGARRRGPASKTSGVLFVGLLIGAMGYYVVKRFRR